MSEIIKLRNGEYHEKSVYERLRKKYDGYKCIENSEYDIVGVYREERVPLYEEGLTKEKLNELEIKDLGLDLGIIEKKIMLLEMERNKIVYELWKRLPKLELDEDLQPRNEKEIKLRWK